MATSAVKRIVTALLMLSTAATPVRAEPVSFAITSFAGWYATIGVTGQLAVQIGAGIALSLASYGLSYLLSGGGKRQQQAQTDNLGVMVEEANGLLERRRLYGTVALSGGVLWGGMV